MRSLNYHEVLERLEGFLRDNANQGVVVGVSGGVDSATSAYLAVRALGKGKVLGLIMPYYMNGDVDDALMVCRNLGIDHKLINIKEVVDSFVSAFDFEPDKRTLGNIMARVRMTILYAHANQMGRLVLGTSNRSEFLTGYFTKWGDGASDVAPLLGLYKTEVWKIAKLLGVPDRIVNKKPTAGLWQGQTDEDELGVSYRILDEILWRLVDLGMSVEETAREVEVSVETVRRILSLIKSSEHKRHLPLSPELP